MHPATLFRVPSVNLPRRDAIDRIHHRVTQRMLPGGIHPAAHHHIPTRIHDHARARTPMPTCRRRRRRCHVPHPPHGPLHHRHLVRRQRGILFTPLLIRHLQTHRPVRPAPRVSRRDIVGRHDRDRMQCICKLTLLFGKARFFRICQVDERSHHGIERSREGSHAGFISRRRRRHRCRRRRRRRQQAGTVSARHPAEEDVFEAGVSVDGTNPLDMVRYPRRI